MSAQVFTGRYQITRKVARGGMAEVYLAQDLLLERPVALKVLFPEFSSDRSFVERFRREARAAANLNHANIVSIYDWGEDDGTYFIVMEYVDGATLREVINTDGPLPAAEAAHIGGEIAGALHFAHLHGVIHRDVKPGNVILSRGQVKVTDFGIARGTDPAESLTQTGAVMGTATYFSPEQAQGHNVDPRSDVYSLGVVLYEMVTKRPPFTGDSPLSIAYQHVREEPAPPSDHNPDVPPLFDALVLKAMAKDRADRHANADELREDLIAFSQGRLYDSRSQPVAVVTPPGGYAAADATMVSALSGNGAGDDTRIAGGPRTMVGHSSPPPRNRTGTYIVVLAALLALLAGLLFLLSRELGGGGTGTQVAVPELRNKTVADARAAIEEAGLKVGQITEEVSEPAGRVLGQDPPAAQRVDRGSAVALRVSVGAAPAPVPNVVNQQIDTATTTLEDAGFVVATAFETSTRVARDVVIRQDPAGGSEAKKGSTVTLTVSSGPEEVRVPEVRGREAGDAAFTLGQAGFRTVQRIESSDDVPAGRVIRTDPGTGTSLPRGSTVAIVVAAPTATTTTTEVTTTTTPDVTTTSSSTTSTSKPPKD